MSEGGGGGREGGRRRGRVIVVVEQRDCVYTILVALVVSYRVGSLCSDGRNTAISYCWMNACTHTIYVDNSESSCCTSIQEM